MGIKDLLQNVNGIVEDKHITDFSGGRVAIDASGWLHKGLYGAAEDLVDNNFEDTQLYVDFILSRVRTLMLNNVEPVVVFDGKRSTLKNETAISRGDTRKSYMDQGKHLLDNMRKASDSTVKAKFRREAISNFQKGLSVTTDMEKNTIGALRKMGVKVIVAPYEADPQLAYLCHTEYCQAVLTEDSDVLVYSAICGTPFPVLYKFDKCGSVECIRMTNIMPAIHQASGEVPPAQSDMGITIGGSVHNNNKAKSSKKSTKSSSSCKINTPPVKGFLNLLALHFAGSQGRRMFCQVCILAGCDYVDSVTGVGLVTALQAVVKCRDGPDDERFERVIDLFRSLKKKIPEKYLIQLKKAEALFHYHPVFDLDSGEVLSFCPEPLLDTPFPRLIMDTDTKFKNEEKNMTCHSPLLKGMRSSPRKSRSDSIESIDDDCDDDFQNSKINNSNNKFGIQLKIEIPTPISSEFIPPMISQIERAQLGCFNANIELLRNSPSNISICDICLGIVSCKDYLSITPKYPWIQYSKPFNAKKGSYWSGFWGTRRSLMEAEKKNNTLNIPIKINSNIKSMNLRQIFLRGGIKIKSSSNVLETNNCSVFQQAPRYGEKNPSDPLFTIGKSEGIKSILNNSSVLDEYKITDLTYISDDESAGSTKVTFEYDCDSKECDEYEGKYSDTCLSDKETCDGKINSSKLNESGSNVTDVIINETNDDTPDKMIDEELFIPATNTSIVTLDSIDKVFATPSTGGTGTTISTVSTIPTPEMPLERIIPEELSPDAEESAKRPYNPFKKNAGAGTPSLANRMISDTDSRSSPSKSPMTMKNPTCNATTTRMSPEKSPLRSSTSPLHTTSPVNLSPLKNITNLNSNVVDLTNGSNSSSSANRHHHLNFMPPPPIPKSNSGEKRKIVTVQAKAKTTKKGKSSTGSAFKSNTVSMVSISSFFGKK